MRRAEAEVTAHSRMTRMLQRIRVTVVGDDRSAPGAPATRPLAALPPATHSHGRLPEDEAGQTSAACRGSGGSLR